MYFHRWSRHSPQGIVQSHAGVGVGSGVKYDAIHLEAARVNTVYEVAFVVALIITELYVGVLLAQFFEIVFKAASTIYSGLAATEEVQVGAVDDLNLLHSL
jgi:hypothetical protein